MPSFSKEQVLERLSDNKFRLIEPLYFYWNDDKTGKYVVIPAGTVVNGADYPLFVCKLFGWKADDQDVLLPSAVHDYLVGQGCPRGSVLPENRKVSWYEASLWFDRALRVRSEHSNKPMSTVKRKLIVKAVQVYGVVNGKR